jgi:hypothetical protein
MELEPPTVIQDLLNMDLSPPDTGKPVYDLAPETPLVLIDCIYPPDTFQWNHGQSRPETTVSRILPKSTVLDSRITRWMDPMIEMWRYLTFSFFKL